MILRRIAESFRRQDWLVVFVELIVVVVGIYIGLQVDDWNEARQNQARDRQALNLFLEDIDLMIAATDRDIEATKAILMDLSVSMETIYSCRATPEERETLNHTVNALRGWRLPNFFVAGFENLKESGTLARFENPEFSRKVGQLGEGMIFLNTAGQIYDRELNEAFGMIETFATPRRIGDNPKPVVDGAPIFENYDLAVQLEDICRNDSFLKALIQANDTYLGFLSGFEDFKTTLMDVREIIPEVKP